MMRSGSTLQFQITARLVEEAGLGKRMEWVKPERFPELQAKYADYDGWKVFKTHFCTETMISESAKQNAMGVYVFRDIRDVFVSMMKKSGTTFDNLLNQGLIDECMRNFQRWTSLPRVSVSKYEDIISDLTSEVVKIATHLNISLSHKKYEQIASDYTMQQQLKRIKKLKVKLSPQEPKATGHQFDYYSLLHTNHINSGQIGRWKHDLSSKQVAIIEDRARNWLVANGYKLVANQNQSIFKRVLLRFR